MSIKRGPGFDKFLMRTKDIVWLLGMLWAILKGIDAYKERLKNLESMIIAQNISIGNIQGKLKDMSETLNAIRYPDRYGRRRKSTDDEN